MWLVIPWMKMTLNLKLSVWIVSSTLQTRSREKHANKIIQETRKVCFACTCHSTISMLYNNYYYFWQNQIIMRLRWNRLCKLVKYIQIILKESIIIILCIAFLLTDDLWNCTIPSFKVWRVHCIRNPVADHRTDAGCVKRERCLH